jgi:activator of HSP90 ATPase
MRMWMTLIVLASGAGGTVPGPTEPCRIHQEVTFKASPAVLYEALMNAKQFTIVSGAPAEISRDVGGPWSAYGGLILGRNVELVPNQRIVQAWRSKDWPEGTYSIVKFELRVEGLGTRVVLDHVGFPEGKAEHLAEGWQKHYWEPLQKYLTSR